MKPVPYPGKQRSTLGAGQQPSEWSLRCTSGSRSPISYGPPSPEAPTAPQSAGLSRLRPMEGATQGGWGVTLSPAAHNHPPTSSALGTKTCLREDGNRRLLLNKSHRSEDLCGACKHSQDTSCPRSWGRAQLCEPQWLPGLRRALEPLESSQVSPRAGPEGCGRPFGGRALTMLYSFAFCWLGLLPRACPRPSRWGWLSCCPGF